MKKTQPEMSNCSCEEAQVNVWTALIIESIVIPVVSGFGFLANLCVILVLLNPEIESTCHMTLLTLAAI